MTARGGGDPRARGLPSPVVGVRLWELDLSPRPGDGRAALLDGADRDRLAVLEPGAAQALLARRALVAGVVADLVGRPIGHLAWTREYGAPRVVVPGEPHPLPLSLASSGRRALLAVAAGPVGVDLEVASVLPDVREVAEALLPDPERAWIAAAAGDAQASDRFLRTWVRKEAVVKATGEGLAGRDPRSFVVDARQDVACPVLDDAGGPLGLWTLEVPLPGAVAALAVPEAALDAAAA